MENAVYLLLAVTSVVCVGVIIWRAWSLRWNAVVPPQIVTALENCRTRADVKTARALCDQYPSPLGRLIARAADHADWPKADNMDALETAARHEVVHLERGLVVLEVIIGIAPLLGLVGTIAGMMGVFGDLGVTGLNDAQKLAQGIALILRATLAGLLIAIPSLIFWSYFSKKVEVLAVEMETLCDGFIRRQYTNASDISDAKFHNDSTPALPTLIQPLQTASSLSPQLPVGLFPKRAAIYSVFAPLICLVNGALTRHLQHSSVAVGLIIALISISLVTSGLILGIKALISCKRNKLKGVLGWAITGICLNGTIILVMLVGILFLFIVGLTSPNVAQQVLQNQ